MNRRPVPLFRGIALACLALLAFAAHAETTAFGTHTLEIPAPAGFEPASHDMPGYVQFSQAYLPRGNRLVEAYLTPADKARMRAGKPGQIEKYFQLQTLRTLDGKPLTDAQFAAAMAPAEAQIQEAATKFGDQAKALSEQGNAAVGGQTKAEVAIGGPELLGVFRREPWGLFFSASNPVKVEVDGKVENVRLLNGSAIVLVDGQILYLYAYANATDPQARAWVENSVSAWADALRAANVAGTVHPAAVASAPTQAPGPAPQRKVFNIVLAVIAVLLMIFLWRRKRA